MELGDSRNITKKVTRSNGLSFLVIFILILWTIKAIEVILDLPLYKLGVYPRSINGLFGVLFSPLLHADIFHLISNSIPILILGALLLLVYRKYALDVSILIYFSSGILLWFIGRESYHIGASGLVYGLFGFIFFMGFFLNQNNSMLISAALFFLYGGIFYGIFPNRPEISWEAHLSGLLVGFIIAFVFRGKYRIVDIKSKNSENVNCNFTKNDTNFVYYYKEDKASEES